MNHRVVFVATFLTAFGVSTISDNTMAEAVIAQP